MKLLVAICMNYLIILVWIPESLLSDTQLQKKCLKGVDVEVSVKDRTVTFRGEIFLISAFIVGEMGKPYCTIPDDYLKLLNKFLGTTINNSKIEFCKSEDKFLFLVDKEHYYIDI